MKNEVLISLYKRPETVFSLRDISLLMPEINFNNLKKRMFYLVSKGMIRKVRRGIFVKDNYDVLELANKLYSPSYVSLETVLAKAGIIFQYYREIFSISYLSRSLSVDGNDLRYRKTGDEILFNHKGIEKINQAEVATKERAFLDAVFLYRDYHFDNLRPLEWEKIEELKMIYNSKILNRRLNSYYQIYRNDNV